MLRFALSRIVRVVFPWGVPSALSSVFRWLNMLSYNLSLLSQLSPQGDIHSCSALVGFLTQLHTDGIEVTMACFSGYNCPTALSDSGIVPISFNSFTVSL